MRIFIIGLNAAPECVGVGPYTTTLATYLAQRGHTVHILAAPPYYPQWQRQPIPNQDHTRKNLSITRCPTWIPHNPTSISRLLHLTSFGISSAWYAWKKAANFQPDIIMTIAPTLMAVPATLLAAHLTKATTWLHMHDLEWRLASGLGFFSHKLTTLAKTIGSGLVRSFNVVSTLSQPMANELSASGVVITPDNILPNWVDMNRFQPDAHARNRLRQRLGVAPESRVILFCGSMGKKQYIEGMLQLAAHYTSQPDIVFAICGEGPTKKKLETTCNIMNLRNVVFKSLFWDKEFPHILSGADIHYAVQNEGARAACLPSKIGPILACGGRILASSDLRAAAPELVEAVGDDIVFVKNNRPEEMICALDSFLHHDTSKPSLQARHAAAIFLSQDVVLKKFEEALMKGAEKRTGRKSSSQHSS